MAHLGPLVELVFSGKTGKFVRFPGGIEAVGRGGKLFIGPMREAELKDPHGEVLAVPGPGNYVFGPYRFEVCFRDGTDTRLPASGTDCILMDADELKWPIELRFRRPGDRFRPLGMSGSKKLQDFFTDCLVPREERNKVPLLCDSEKICWVAGMRMDDRVKVKDRTRTILMVRLFRLSRNGEQT
jgi:tRNA(Ile)-lysidine synthase